MAQFFGYLWQIRLIGEDVLPIAPVFLEVQIRQQGFASRASFDDFLKRRVVVSLQSARLMQGLPPQAPSKKIKQSLHKFSWFS